MIEVTDASESVFWRLKKNSYEDKGVKNILSHELRTIFRRKIRPDHVETDAFRSQEDGNSLLNGSVTVGAPPQKKLRIKSLFQAVK